MPEYVAIKGRPANTDPLRNFRFRVEIHHVFPSNSFYKDVNMARLGFMSVSGIGASTEPISYREGGDNVTPRVMPGQTGFAPLALTRGLLVGGDNVNPSDTKLALWQWYKQIFYVMEGASDSGTGVNPPPTEDFRTDVYLRIYDHPTTRPQGGWLHPKPRAAFKFFNCWPQALAFSDLDAGGNGIIVQNLTLAHEGFDVRVDPVDTAAAW